MMMTSHSNTDIPSDDGLFDLSQLPAEVREIILAQRLILRAASGMRSDEWASLELSMSQLKALAILTVQRGMTVSEVAEKQGIGKPAASVLIDGLTHLGYVTRTEDPDDRRRTVVTPTERADELLARLRQTGGQHAMVDWLLLMEPDDLAALKRGTQALAEIVARATHDQTQTNCTRGE